MVYTYTEQYFTHNSNTFLKTSQHQFLFILILLSVFQSLSIIIVTQLQFSFLNILQTEVAQTQKLLESAYNGTVFSV